MDWFCILNFQTKTLCIEKTFHCSKKKSVRKAIAYKQDLISIASATENSDIGRLVRPWKKLTHRKIGSTKYTKIQKRKTGSNWKQNFQAKWKTGPTKETKLSHKTNLSDRGNKLTGQFKPRDLPIESTIIIGLKITITVSTILFYQYSGWIDRLV